MEIKTFFFEFLQGIIEILNFVSLWLDYHSFVQFFFCNICSKLQNVFRLKLGTNMRLEPIFYKIAESWHIKTAVIFFASTKKLFVLLLYSGNTNLQITTQKVFEKCFFLIY